MDGWQAAVTRSVRRPVVHGGTAELVGPTRKIRVSSSRVGTMWLGKTKITARWLVSLEGPDLSPLEEGFKQHHNFHVCLTRPSGLSRYLSRQVAYALALSNPAVRPLRV